jgi:hypothetical protein
MVEKNKSETPRCEFRGCLPHAAEPAYLIVWSLTSGPVVKWSCAAHRFRFGGNRTPVVAKVEHFAGDEPSPTHSESGDEMEQAKCVDPAAAAATVRPHKNDTSASATEDICIRCRKAPALPYPLGCGGQLCQRCVDLQNTEYRQWVAEQRALGNIRFANGEPESRLVR